MFFLVCNSIWITTYTMKRQLFSRRKITFPWYSYESKETFVHQQNNTYQYTAFIKTSIQVLDSVLPKKLTKGISKKSTNIKYQVVHCTIILQTSKESRLIRSFSLLVESVQHQHSTPDRPIILRRHSAGMNISKIALSKQSSEMIFSKKQSHNSEIFKLRRAKLSHAKCMLPL